MRALAALLAIALVVFGTHDGIDVARASGPASQTRNAASSAVQSLVAPPGSALRYISGISVEARGTASCSPSLTSTGTGTYTHFDTGSSSLDYVFTSAAPVTRQQAIVLVLSATAAVNISLFGPNGLIGTSTSTNLTYYASGARPGQYTLPISGPLVRSGTDCGLRVQTTTSSAFWNGQLVYPILPTLGLNLAALAQPAACAQLTPLTRYVSC